MSGKKYKIGVYGSADGDYADFVPVAKKIGKELGKHADSVIVVTGACPGLPYAAAREAAARSVEVWGFSSSCDPESQRREYPDDDLSIYAKVFYVPESFSFGNERVCKKYRNIISTTNCDAAIIISGRWGTLNEFTNLIDFGKTVGVMTGTKGIADELPALSSKISKAGQGRLFFENKPDILVKKLLDNLN